MSYKPKTDRITLEDSGLTAIIKLADGNPGAITALTTMYKEAAAIDPDSAFGGFGPLFALDTMGIYGSEIWVLWKDICGYSTLNMETLFRSAQLGKMPNTKIIAAARSADTGERVEFDFPALLAEVQKELPAFGTAVI